MRERLCQRFILTACVAFLVLISAGSGPAVASSTGEDGASFPPALADYDDADGGLLERLQHRVQAVPFNLAGTLIFLLAIIHTFLAGKFTALSHRCEQSHQERVEKGAAPRHSVSSTGRLFHFLGEIEVVFGLWAVVLTLAIVGFFDWSTAVDYLSHGVNFTEPMFVVVIMALSSTRPILKLAETLMSRVARLFGGTLGAWWLTILTIGPLLGSFITEPAAMTICALLLARKFYALQPSRKFKYATLGLLFVNISVGGTLTHFAAPPVLMVAGPWGWGIGHMLLHFGWKSALGILISNLLYWFLFRGEFRALRDRFTVRALKEQVLTTYLSREQVEREIDKIASELRAQSGFEAELSSVVEQFTEKIRNRLEQEYLKSIADTDVEPELAVQAFRQRFDEIKLYRFQKEVPHLLPQEQRAPFKDPNWDQREDPVPVWIMLVHVLFMSWTIANAHHPPLFVAGLLFFLGFATVTADYQNNIDLKAPLLVGFFLGGLVTHGGVQGWWIEPVLGGLTVVPLMLTATVLTAFNDNAAITYLSTLVPGFTEALKYAVVAGAVTGGGLTVIANAPNPAGQAILKDHFGGSVSPVGLLKGAIVPTVVLFLIFLLFR